MHYARMLAAVLGLAASTAHAYTLVPIDSRGTGAEAIAVAIGDVNGDSLQDIVVATGYSNEAQYSFRLLVHLQQPDGAFAVALAFPYSPTARSGLAIGNLDSDRAQEIVVGHGSGITILDWDTSRGVKTVKARTYGNPGWRFPEHLVLLDADRDGALDVLGKSFGADLVVHLGDGQGGVRNTVQVPLAIDGYTDLAAGDFNDDGYADVAVLSSVLRGYVFLNNGTAGFSPPNVINPTPTGSGFYPTLAGGDFNGDGRDDLVILSDSSKLALFNQTVDHQLVLSDTLTSANFPDSMLGHDFDLDGRDDLLVQYLGGPLRLFLQTASGLSAQPVFQVGVGPTRNGLAAGDLDGDDCTDLAIASDSAVTMYKGQGCHPVADLAVSLGLTGSMVAVRLDNFGPGVAVAPQMTISLDVSPTTLAVGALPGGCAITAQDTASATLTCGVADLAAGSSRTLLVPISVEPTHHRGLVSAAASASAVTVDLHLKNNTAQKSARLSLPGRAPRAAVR